MKGARKLRQKKNIDIGMNKESSTLETAKGARNLVNSLSKPFICEVCKKTFLRRGSLILHLETHDTENRTAEGSKKHCEKERPHSCNICQKRFTAKKNLLKHLRIIHKNSNEAEKLQVRKTRCPEKDCSFTCRKVRDLRTHIEKCHGIKILKDCLQFSNDALFQKWKKEEESNSVSWFVAFRRKSVLRNGNRKQTLSCHRTGQYNPKGSGKHRLKSHGSCKIGGTCPAAMEVSELPDGQLTVVYYKTHLGHSQDVVHLQLSREERVKLSERIEQGFSLDAILEDIKESIDPADGTTKRIHLLSRKDLYNIMQSFNSSKIKKRAPKNKRESQLEAEKATGNETSEITSCPLDPISKPTTTTVNAELYTVYSSNENGSIDELNRAVGTDDQPPILHYHRLPDISANSNEAGTTSQVVIVSPDISYRSVTEVILVHPSDSLSSHLHRPTVFPSELITYENARKETPEPSKAASLNATEGENPSENSTMRISEVENKGKFEVKSALTSKLQDKVEKILNFLPKSDILTPKQFDSINKKLDSIIEIYTALSAKANSKKTGVKKLCNKTIRMPDSWKEKESSRTDVIVPAEQTIVQQPVYESPLYAYLCNYN